MRQFATHAYSSIFITGLNFWQGGAANYWGHNAIIRIEPFVEHCRLPKLPGKEPLGGSILSHDFVEAAFMRRAGWKVYLASELRGSYEEVPPSLISYAARDRRWCQGNMQHARLLFTPGLHPVNRLHLVPGNHGLFGGAVVDADVGVEHHRRHSRNNRTASLFSVRARRSIPSGESGQEQQAIWLFLTVMGLLIVPKAAEPAHSPAAPREERAAFGGRRQICPERAGGNRGRDLAGAGAGLLADAILSLGILLGKNIKWDAQDRGEAQTTIGEAVRRLWPSTLLGVVWSVLLLEDDAQTLLVVFAGPGRISSGDSDFGVEQPGRAWANGRGRRACF